MEETGGELVIELNYLGKEPNTFVGDTSDLNLFLFAGIVDAPASPGSPTITSEFTSVSRKMDEDIRILRRTTQSASFVSADPTRANLVTVFPLLFVGGEFATLQGSNFGDSPTVIFPAMGGTTIEVGGIIDESGDLLVPILGGVVDGMIQLDNGLGPGNSYHGKVMFAPAFAIRQGNGPADHLTSAQENPSLTISFSQPAEQFMLSEFQVDLFEVDSSLADLTVDTVVGTGRMNSSEFDLVVASSETDQGVLNVLQSGSSDPNATITVEKIVDDKVILRLTYASIVPPSEPGLLENPLDFELKFTALPIVLPAAGEIVIASATMTSTPTGVGGAISALTAGDSFPFLSE